MANLNLDVHLRDGSASFPVRVGRHSDVKALRQETANSLGLEPKDIKLYIGR